MVVDVGLLTLIVVFFILFAITEMVVDLLAIMEIVLDLLAIIVMIVD